MRHARRRHVVARSLARSAAKAWRPARHATVLALAAAIALGAGAAPARGETLSVPIAKGVTLTGELGRPSGAGPHPAVILLHGCGGINRSVPVWARALQDAGYVTLLLDSLHGRGLTSVCIEYQRLSMTERVGDVYAAAARLAAAPGIDPGRIGVLGYSHGGGTAILASAAGARYPDVKIRAFVALWPGCGQGMSAGPLPVLMLLGGADDWTPPERCQEIASAAKREGKPVTVVVYPGAGHGFGYPHLKDQRSPTPGRMFVPGVRGGRGATLIYDPAAHGDAEKQALAFLAEHLKQ